jgi:hypothetical protein
MSKVFMRVLLHKFFFVVRLNRKSEAFDQFENSI